MCSVRVGLVASGGGRFLSLLLLTSRRRDVVSGCLRQNRVFTLCSSNLGTVSMIAYRKRNVCRVGGVTIYPSSRHGKCKGQLISCLFKCCRNEYSIVLINAKSAPSALSFCRRYNFHVSRQLGGFFASGCSRPVCRSKGLLASVICLQGSFSWFVF